MANVKLTNQQKVFRGSAGVTVRGDAIVAIPDPMPPDVMAAIGAGMLQVTSEEPRANQAGPLRAGGTIPKLVPHYRGGDLAAVPNSDVSTTRTGQHNGDATNPGPTGLTSQQGKAHPNEEIPAEVRALQGSLTSMTVLQTAPVKDLEEALKLAKEREARAQELHAQEQARLLNVDAAQRGMGGASAGNAEAAAENERLKAELAAMRQQMEAMQQQQQHRETSDDADSRSIDAADKPQVEPGGEQGNDDAPADKADASTKKKK